MDAVSISPIRGVKYPSVKIEISDPSVFLVPLGCLHVGAANFDEEKTRKTVDWIKTNRALWAGLGDLIENSNKTSPGDGVYKQKLTPREQIDLITELLSPIAGTCIGCITGNHEARSINLTGIDPTHVICSNLDIPYMGVELYANIIISPEKKSSRSFTIYANHSTMASKTVGLELNAIERDMEKFLNFDIIIKGHGHKAELSGPYINLEYDRFHNVVTEKRRWLMLSGAFFGDRPDSYASMKPTRPGLTGTIAAKLETVYVRDNTEKKVTAIDLRYL